MHKRTKQTDMMQNFQEMIPRSIFAEADPDILDKQAATFSGLPGMSGSTFNTSLFANYGGSSSNNIYRNPARRFYDPEITSTAIFLPRNVRQKNRWCRWFFDHDEIVGPVLELHAELPYSRAEIVVDDPRIRAQVEECFERTDFFTKLPQIDLEFMKIGEVFIYNTWNDSLGMWDNIIIHNPDFVEVTASPFADTESVLELKPDDELKKIVHSTRPEDQQLKKRLPKEIVRRVVTGKNILLNSNEATHIARRSNPYDVRGTSIINRLFKLLMYEDKLREGQMTIADNFIYPLKIFKLGDSQKGWIPDESHQKALASMLQQANFDPNFSLIYHYGLEVDVLTVADKVMKLDKEWTDINERKMIALGVSKEFLMAGGTYSSANVALQTQLARYKAKRDLFEVKWIHNKFLRIMAEKNGWYKRDAREILNKFRVTRKGEELRQRLIIPRLMWHKKLMLRDDQQFLTFLNNVYANGKGPVSGITLLMAMGLDSADELHNKGKQKELEQMIGAFTQAPPAAAGGGAPGAGGPPMGPMAKLKDKFKFGNKEVKETAAVLTKDAQFLIKEGNHQDAELKTLTIDEALLREAQYTDGITNELTPIDDASWQRNIQASTIPTEVAFILNTYNNKLSAVHKKYNGTFNVGVLENKAELLKSLNDVYVQGKLTAYGWTSFLPIYKQHFAQGNDLRDYSDLVLSNEFEDWIEKLATLKTNDAQLVDATKVYKHIRDLAATCFCFGQLKGFQEQGIFNVKLSNTSEMDGLRYKVEELLEKGRNLFSLVSPTGEVVLITPCIEGFDEGELGNSIDPRITRHATINMVGIEVKDCPIEYLPAVKRYVNKFGKYLKKNYDTVIFVQDVVNLPEWEETLKRGFEQEYKGLDAKIKTQAVMAGVLQEKAKKTNKEATFTNARTLYLSSWVGMEDSLLIDNLIKYIPLDNDMLYKTVNKLFKKAQLDLSDEEINTYKVFKYIEAIKNNNNEVIGWKAAESIDKTASVDEKVSIGKVWDISGKCTNNFDTDPINIFKNNLSIWFNYPHKLSAELNKAYSEL